MDRQRDVRGGDAGLFEGRVDAFEDGLLRCVGCRQQLQAILTAAMLQNHIGECAADIDGQPRPIFHARSA